MHRYQDRDHEHVAAQRGTPPRKDASSAAAGWLELQRMVGNDAVQRIIQRERATQPLAHAILRSAGRPLDEPVREEMEARLGADFSDVRLHTGPDAERSAAELGASAYTVGNRIVAGPGGVDPHTLAHELTHVVQQRRGPVDGVDTGAGLAISDPGDRFEREAEANAERAMRSEPAESAAVGPTPGAQAGTPVVQRRVQLDGSELRPDDWSEIETLPQFQERSPQLQDAMRGQFLKWVDDTEVGQNQSGESHPLYGRKRQDRLYGTAAELELGLAGWVEAKPERHQEKLVAQDVSGSSEVELRLNKLLFQLLDKIQRLDESGEGEDGAALTNPERKQEIIAELNRQVIPTPTGGVRAVGLYQAYFEHKANQTQTPAFKTNIQNGFYDVLVNPERYNFRDKVIALHDLAIYFGPRRSGQPVTRGEGLLAEPDERHMLATTSLTDTGARETTTERGRHAGPQFQSTRDELHATTRFARQHKIPVWSGASYTTARMMQLGEWVDASQDDLTALAHSIFAFWRLDYDHTSTAAPHTLHEVMDIAQNYGVPYDALDRYAEFGYGDVDEEQRKLKAEIDQTVAGITGRYLELANALNAGRVHFKPVDRAGIKQNLDQLTGLAKYLHGFSARFAAKSPQERVTEISDVLKRATFFEQFLRNVVAAIDSVDSSSEEDEEEEEEASESD